MVAMFNLLTWNQLDWVGIKSILGLRNDKLLHTSKYKYLENSNLFANIKAIFNVKSTSCLHLLGYQWNFSKISKTKKQKNKVFN